MVRARCVVFFNYIARGLLRKLMGSPGMITRTLFGLLFLGVQGFLPYTITGLREIGLKSRTIA